MREDVEVDKHTEGSEDAGRFESSLSANYDDLMRFAIRRVGPDAAADVVSETFLAAWRRRQEVTDASDRVWLFGVARNVVANQLRARSRRERLGGRLSQARPELDASFDDVYLALDQLRTVDREVLTLVEWDGLSQVEAAGVLGCSPEALRVRLHRARRRFATIYARVTSTETMRRNRA